MQTHKILSAPLIDLVFDGRDKDYGAYELRKNYSRRISRAMLVTLLLAALVSGTVIFANATKKNAIADRVGPEVELADVPKEPEPLPEPEKMKEPEPVKTEPYTIPDIVPDDDMDKPMPPIETLDSARIGDVKIEGPPDTGIPNEIKDPFDGKGIGELPPTQKEPEIYTTVQVQAEYDGDWKRFLETTLNANTPVDNGAAPGRYSVLIEFVVDTEGGISDLKPFTNHGYGMETEAMRAIKKSKKWKPAIQNGRQVKAYRKQVIVFIVNEE
jgi:periplasmic protein TonB